LIRRRDGELVMRPFRGLRRAVDTAEDRIEEECGQ
jgi:hypothetical protein